MCGLALATTTSRTLGVLEHRSGDEGLQVSLEEPSEASEIHGLGDRFHPGRGAVNEESILSVRGRHADVNRNLVKTIK